MIQEPPNKTRIVLIAIISAAGIICAALIGLGMPFANRLADRYLPTFTPILPNETDNAITIPASTGIPLASAVAEISTIPVLLPADTISSQVPFSDWEVAYPSDIHKRVEFKRCENYPEYGFPDFGNQAGLIPLPLTTGKNVNGQLAWCFQVRFATPLDEWLQYVKGIDPAYANEEPEGIAVYFPMNQSQPAGLTVLVDDRIVLGFPPDGISLYKDRVIKVFIPINSTESPTVTTGPYSIGATYILK